MINLTLNSGRDIELVGLHVERTYEGWIDGVPDNNWNNRILEGLSTRAKRMFDSGIPLYVVEPDRKIPNDLPNIGMAPEFLPEHWFVGKFCSEPIDSRGQGERPANRSWLVVSWYQSEAETVPSTATTEALSSVPWESVAIDIDAWE